PNDTRTTATDLGKVTAQRVVPRLSLVPGEEDWFQVQAGATGQLVIGASAPAQGDALRMELWDATDPTRKTPLAVGTAVVENGVVAGVRTAYQAPANQTYLVRVLGSGPPEYSLAVQALTADLGTTVQGARDGAITAGGSDVYRLVAGVGGTLNVQLTS